MFTATLNGAIVATSISYAPLEAEYAESAAIITNTDTGVSWPADPEFPQQVRLFKTAHTGGHAHWEGYNVPAADLAAKYEIEEDDVAFFFDGKAEAEGAKRLEQHLAQCEQENV